MSYILLFAFGVRVVAPSPAQSLDLAQFELGAIAPIVAELDDDPNTIEWIAWTDFGLWVIDPTTLCKSMVTVNLGHPAPRTFYVAYVQRIAGKDRLVLIDTDKSDGYLPASVHNITSPCYPTK